MTNDKNYSIVTGYWSGKGWRGSDDNFKADFFKAWYENTMKFSAPKDVFVINPNSETLPAKKKGKWIDLSFNLGHVHDLDVNEFQPKRFGGWSMSFIMGCLLAFSNNTDLIFKEQDCLAFGPWVERMYQDLEDQNVKMLVGRSEDAKGQGLEQSLLLVKHEMLLPFVTSYMSFPFNDAGVGYMRPEQKFLNVIHHKHQGSVGTLSFGYGRERPDMMDFEEPFYFQQISPEEFAGMKRNEFI